MSYSLSELGIAYTDLDDNTKAIEYHEQALEIRKILYGENHNDVANSYKNIADCYYTL